MSTNTVQVDISDTELFKEFLSIFADAMNDERIPRDIRDHYVNRLLEAGVLPE